MFSLFKNNYQKSKKEETNSFLDIENSVYHTEDSVEPISEIQDYSGVSIQRPTIEEIPAYKAMDNKRSFIVSFGDSTRYRVFFDGTKEEFEASDKL